MIKDDSGLIGVDSAKAHQGASTVPQFINFTIVPKKNATEARSEKHRPNRQSRHPQDPRRRRRWILMALIHLNRPLDSLELDLWKI